MAKGDIFVNGVRWTDADLYGRDEPMQAEAASPLAMPQEQQQQIAADEQMATEAKADNPRYYDPGTAWFKAGPMSREVFNEAKQLGEIQMIDEAFVRKESFEKPQSLDEYIELGNHFIQQAPDLAPYIKQKLLDEMPERLQAEYEARIEKTKIWQKVYDEAEMIKARTELLSPHYEKMGYTIDPSGKAIDSTKAEDLELRRKELRAKRLDSIRTAYEKAMDKYEEAKEDASWASSPEEKSKLAARAARYRRTADRYATYLEEEIDGTGAGEMPGEPQPVSPGAGPILVGTQEEYNALPPGTRYVDPNGAMGVKR